MGLFTAYHAAERRRARRRARARADRRPDDRVLRPHPLVPQRLPRRAPTRGSRTRHSGCGATSRRDTRRDVLVRCGCMNIAKRSVTPDLAGTYAQLSYETLDAARPADGVVRRRRRCAGASPTSTPTWRASTSTAASSTCPPSRARCTRGSTSAACETLEGVETTAIVRDGARSARDHRRAASSSTRALVVTAGHGTNDVLALLPGCTLQVPITQGPAERGQVPHPARRRARDRSPPDAMPVIAYLDAGIYCHPIVDGLVDAVKIGYYNPPDLPRGATPHRQHRELRRAVHAGAAARDVRDVEDVDQCDYDLVADDDFVLGAIPGFAQRVRRRRLARHRLQVRALGGARARRAARCRAAPSTTSAASTRPGSRKGDSDEPSVAEDPAAAPR